MDKEAKKKEILKSAITLFARNGIANTKISDIAIEANMSNGNIYLYFESKEEIIKESIRSYLAKLDKAGADHVAGVGGTTILFSFFDSPSSSSCPSELVS